MEHHVLMKTALEKGRENARVPERGFQLTPPHIDPIWPIQRRHVKKTKSLGSLIRTRMLLFRFVHAVNANKTIEIRPFCPEDEEEDGNAWLMCENILTLVEKASEESMKNLQRLREIQSDAYANGRHSGHLTERTTDFHFPLCMQSYRAETYRPYQDVLSSCRKNCEPTLPKIPRLLSCETNRSNEKLVYEKSTNCFDRGERRSYSRFTGGEALSTKRCRLTSSGGFLKNPSEDPRFRGLYSVLVPPPHKESDARE